MNTPTPENRIAPEGNVVGRGNRSVFLKLLVVVGGIFALLCLLAAVLFFRVASPHHVRRIVSAPFRSPERPDTANPATFDGARFTFCHPANWHLDTEHDEVDPDSFVILNAPRRGQVRLMVVDNEIDAEAVVEQTANKCAESSIVRMTDRSEFHSWGEYDGYGLNLAGKKLGEPFQIRIFAHVETVKSFVVQEFWHDGPDSINATGFALIEDSFRMSEPGNHTPE